MIEWITETLRNNPAMAIFLVLGLGFLIGKLKYKTLSLGTVTSVLLVGVLVGQLDIPVPGPLKQVSFLLFLFAIGYSVGPQFFAAMRGSGLKQVLFAVVMSLLVFGCTFGVALLFGYNKGEAAGLFAGSQTMSAAIGVADDTISTLTGASAADKQHWADIVPVGYAVTYIFGTIGSAWIIAQVGPMMLGGIKKVRQQTRELAASMNSNEIANDPTLIEAAPEVVYRGYVAEGDFFASPRTVAEIEQHIAELGRRGFVDRVRHSGTIVTEIKPETKVCKGDEVVISGRREFIIGDEEWIGPETADRELLTFPIEHVPVMVANKSVAGTTVADFRKADYARGVIISEITRGETSLPVLAKTQLMRGDMVTLVGEKTDVERAGKAMGFIDRPSTSTDMVFVSLGIVIGCIIGVLSLHIGNVPVSLSTSGGALIMGLVLGWLRTKRPTFGFIPKPVVWIFNNVGLNLFIAVVGLAAAPTFISGLQQMGWQLLVAGALATSIPLLLGIIIGDKIFHFHPAINLGCVAGARTTTAALGAVQDALGSTIPAMGYTITYAIGNTLLILAGLIIVLVI